MRKGLCDGRGGEYEEEETIPSLPPLPKFRKDVPFAT